MNVLDRDLFQAEQEAPAAPTNGGRSLSLRIRGGGRPDPAESTVYDIDLPALLGFVRRQFWMAFGTAMVVFIIAVLHTVQLTPRFTATALVLVDPRAPHLVDLETQFTAAPSVSGIVDSEVEVIRSDAVLGRAIRMAQLQAEAEFVDHRSLVHRFTNRIFGGEESAPDGDPALIRVINALRDHITIERRGATFVIAVSATSESGQRAARIANAIAEAYLAEQIEAKIATAREAESAHAARVQEIRTELSAIESFLDDVLLDAALTATSTVPVRDALADLTGALQRVSVERQTLAMEAGELAASLEHGDLDAVIDATRTPDVAALAERRLDLSKELDRLLSARSAGVETVRAEISTIEDRLADLARARRAAIAARLDVIDTEVSVLRRNVWAAIGTETATGFGLHFYKRQKDAETTRALYEAALGRLRQARTETGVQIANARLVSRAITPIDPSFPPTALFLSLALVGGSALGCGLGMFRERYLTGFVNVDHLERATGVPVIAAVPEVPDRHKDDAPQDQIVLRPLSPYSEAIRRWMVSLETAANREEGQVVLVTSAVEREGKSTLAVALARAIAKSGKKTLLIDADFRRPSIAALMEISPITDAPDFMDFLADRVTPDALTSLGHRDLKTGLDVFYNEIGSAEATDRLIAGALFQRLMVQARDPYSVIVVDSPPLLPVADARILLRYADLVTLVVRHAETRRSDISAALRELDQPGEPPVVAVLNRLPLTGHDYRRARYAYSGYQ